MLRADVYARNLRTNQNMQRTESLGVVGGVQASLGSIALLVQYGHGTLVSTRTNRTNTPCSFENEGKVLSKRTTEALFACRSLFDENSLSAGF
jgi:hypothetical protein